MQHYRKGLKQIAIEGFWQTVDANVRRSGVHQFKLRTGGNITADDVKEHARKRGFAVEVKEDGTVILGRKRAA